MTAPPLIQNFKPFSKNTLRGFFDVELSSGMILSGYPVRCQSRSRVSPVAAVEFFIRGG